MEKFKELSFEEMQEVDGGFWAAISVGIAVVGACIYVYNNASDMAAGFRDGMSGNYNPPSNC